jgi:hypothetical protein
MASRTVEAPPRSNRNARPARRSSRDLALEPRRPAPLPQEHVARIVRQCLEEGGAVEIDGLGLFRPRKEGGFDFIGRTQPKVFLAYAREDTAAVQELYGQFQQNGFDPWLDVRKLLPGQNWPRSIEQAIEISDFFVACFSRRSTAKRSRFHSELRYALDCATRLPLDGIYLIPIRLDNCPIPRQVARDFQYVDLFPNWNRGFHRIVTAMDREWTKRGAGRRK